MIFVLAGAKPVSMRYDPALMSIGCPSMRWFLGLFLCRLVPVRRWLQTFILWLSDLLSVRLRQWNHHWIDTGSWKWMPSTLLLSRQLFGFPLMLSAFCCLGSIWGFHGCCQPFCCRGSILVSVGDQSCTKLSYCMIRHRSFKWVAVTRTYYGPDVVGIGWDPSDFGSEVDLLVVGFRWMLSAVCCWGIIVADENPFISELVCGIVDG